MWAAGQARYGVAGPSVRPYGRADVSRQTVVADRWGTLSTIGNVHGGGTPATATARCHPLRRGSSSSTQDVRLVTVLGPGGIGKTRFVAEVARRVGRVFPGGVA